MINYTVKPNDTLSQIAYRYQTTVAILQGDNPIIVDPNRILPGWVLTIRTSEEYAIDKARKAKSTSKKADITQTTTSPSSAGLTTKKVMFEGTEVKKGQIGVVTFIRDANLYKLNASGELVVLRKVKKNDGYRVYKIVGANSVIYDLGSAFAKQEDVVYKSIPAELMGPPLPGTAIVVGPGTRPATIKTSDKNAEGARIPQFEVPNHGRTRMQVTKPDGQKLSLELRILSMNRGYSNQYSPQRTNAGWAVHVGGKNLTMLNFNGFLLDSVSNKEVQEFVEIYKEYLTPKNNDRVFSSKIISILHKGIEYKGLITALNLSDDANTPVDQKFGMQFMVLSEKSLTSSEIKKNWEFVIKRDGRDESDFLSDIKTMLTNPITGKYNTHND